MEGAALGIHATWQHFPHISFYGDERDEASHNSQGRGAKK